MIGRPERGGFFTAREVIVSLGGDVHSSTMLMRAGIGPAAHSARAQYRGAAAICPALA